MKYSRLFLKSAALFMALFLCACSSAEITEGEQPAASTTAPAFSENTSQTLGNENEAHDISDALVKMDEAQNSTESEIDGSEVTEIGFNGTSATVSGSGAKVNGSKVTISTAGTYRVSGTTADGQLIVSTAGEDNVNIILAGASITSKSGPAIYSKKADVTTITLEDNTTNYLEDSATYAEVDEKGNPDAALFVKNDLVITGGGTLELKANYGDGIGAKENMTIRSGNIRVTSAGDGIKGKDSLLISGGSITINSGADGIQSSNDIDAAKGWILISGGNIKISSALDAVQAETVLKITGGSFDIKTSSTSSEESAKALKAASSIVVEGGDFRINSADDAVHSNADISISGGNFEISSGDDAFHADMTLNISGGNINVKNSYEGLEAKALSVSDAVLNIIASDDGINASGGTDNSQQGGRMSRDNFAADASCYVNITGGTIYINAGGDGIDSNGSINFAGGKVAVDGPENDGNGPIDYAGDCMVSGGELMISGSAGMAQTPGTSSTQNSVMVYLTSQISSGEVTITDESANTVMSFSPKKKTACVLFSSDKLVTGKTYSVLVNGETLGDFTISSAVSTVGEGGMNHMGGMGGRHEGHGMGDAQPPPERRN